MFFDVEFDWNNWCNPTFRTSNRRLGDLFLKPACHLHRAGELGRKASGKRSPSPQLPFSLSPLQILSYSGFAEKSENSSKQERNMGVIGKIT